MEEYLMNNGWRYSIQWGVWTKMTYPIEIKIIDGMAIVTRTERINADNVKQLEAAIKKLNH